MSVAQKLASNKAAGFERKMFKVTEIDEEELREIFDILKKDKETCSLADLNVALVFLEQQFGYKLEEQVKSDIKEIENNVVDPELTYEQFKDFIIQYEDEAVDQEISEIAEILGEDGKSLNKLVNS